MRGISLDCLPSNWEHVYIRWLARVLRSGISGTMGSERSGTVVWRADTSVAVGQVFGRIMPSFSHRGKVISGRGVPVGSYGG